MLKSTGYKKNVTLWQTEGALFYYKTASTSTRSNNYISNKTFWRFSCILAMAHRNSLTVEI